ncbi:MAG: hypothetical protein CR971_01205, partial [candidate division SR1 bacterium]
MTENKNPQQQKPKKPNGTLSEREVRIQKIKKMQTMGVVPFAQSFAKKDMIADIIKTYENAEHRDINDIIENPINQVKTAGRVTLYRTHGKIAFARILDASEQIQIMFHKSNCKIDISTSDNEPNLVDFVTQSEAKSPEKSTMDSSEKPQNDNNDPQTMLAYKFMEKMVDVGDFIGIEGEVFRTHKGELTIFVSNFKFLSKAVRPMAEKYHGLTDQEELYRKRYIDMTVNPETYKRFMFKSKFYQALRTFYTQEGFTEIQTPILDNAASGAAAKPFITHHNDYDTDVYLRIAFETSLKKATVG